MSTSMIRRINLSHKKLNISLAWRRDATADLGTKNKGGGHGGMGGKGKRGRVRGGSLEEGRGTGC
jgi:hypothetical protein